MLIALLIAFKESKTFLALPLAQRQLDFLSIYEMKE